MRESVVFILVFGGLFVLRVVIATIVFLWILPDGDRCPYCDALTLRLRAVGLNRLMPWFRPSFCIDCGWEGMLRRGPISTPNLALDRELPTPNPHA
jgi:hypothetical protein